MKHKHLTLVALVVAATALTGAGLVSAGHDPVNPDDVYIHEIRGSIQQGQGASICVEDMGEDLNKVTVEGRTTHTDTHIYHDGADGDVVLDIPELTTPPGHVIVVYTNNENDVIANADQEGGGESCPVQGGTTIDGPIVLGAYYLVTGQIELTQGVDITTGPNKADDAPDPGGGGGLTGATTVVSGDSASPGDDIDDVDSPSVEQTQPLYGGPENLPSDDSNAPDVTDDDTTDDARTAVEQVQRAVEDAIASLAGDGSSTDVATNTTNTTNTSDASADATGTDGGNVGAGAVGLTGFLGLLGVLFALIRDRSH